MKNMTKREIIEIYKIWGYEEKETYEPYIGIYEDFYLEKIIGRWARTIRFMSNNKLRAGMYLIDGTYKGNKSGEVDWGFETIIKEG